MQAVIAEHGDYIAEETLALSIEAGDASMLGALVGATTVDVTIDGHEVTLAVTKA